MKTMFKQCLLLARLWVWLSGSLITPVLSKFYLIHSAGNDQHISILCLYVHLHFSKSSEIRHVSSMILSAIPTVPLIEITIFTRNLFCFYEDRQITRVKIMITADRGRDCGSASRINKSKFSMLVVRLWACQADH